MLSEIYPLSYGWDDLLDNEMLIGYSSYPQKRNHETYIHIFKHISRQIKINVISLLSQRSDRALAALRSLSCQ